MTSITSSRRRVRVIVAGALVAVIAASCDSDDSSAPTSTATISTATSSSTVPSPPASGTSPPSSTATSGAPGRADPAAAGFDAAALERLGEQAASAGSTCTVIVRDGEIVDERYWQGTDATTKRPAFSITKSVTSLLVGIAQDAGLLSVDEPASTYIDAWRGTPAADVTIADLLSNVSGRHWDPATDYGEMAIKARDKTAFSIGLAQDEPPGTVWAYNNAAVQTLSAVLRVATGEEPDVLAQRWLFEPLGMASSAMTRDPSGHTTTFSGLETTCRDLARLGQMVLDGGMWGGERIVSEEYLAAATQRPSQPLNAAYGWLWWLNQPGPIASPLIATSGPGGEPSTAEGPLLPGAPSDVFWALGFRNQILAVVPSERIVAVRMGAAPPEGVTFDQTVFTQGVLDAVVRTTGPAGTSAAGAGWSTVHADGRNSDFAPIEGPRDLELAWRRDFDGLVNLGATFDADGRVHITTAADGCHLYVLDPDSGETVWCSDEVDRLAAVSAPLLDVDGNIYVADGDAMHSFDHDGRQRWTTPISGVPLSAQFTAEGRLIFVTHIGDVYVLDRDTGAAMIDPVVLAPGVTFDRSQGLSACAMGRPECPSANTPAVDVETGRVVLTLWPPGAPQAELRAMRYSEDPVPSLEPLWANGQLPGGSASSPDISADGTRVYVTDNDGSLHALDAATGDDVWTFPLGYAAAGSTSTSPDGLIIPAGGGDAPTVAIVDRGDHGELLWRNDELRNRGVATQAANTLAYVTASRGERMNDVVVVDTSTGEELDRVELPGSTLFTVGTTIGPDGTVVVPTFDGQVFGLTGRRSG